VVWRVMAVEEWDMVRPCWWVGTYHEVRQDEKIACELA
jgi:hypothetical protein